MPAKLLKGRYVALSINAQMTRDIAALRTRGITPSLAMIRMGERPDSIAYEKSVVKRCKAIGINARRVLLPEDTPQKILLNEIKTLNNDKSVHGILIFRPLPAHIDDSDVRQTLKPEKDVDGTTDRSLAGVFTGSGEGFPPCTARACMEILDYYKINCAGKRAVVVGRSLVVGKPAAVMLTAKDATVTVCHTKTADLPATVRNADIVIVAAGKAGAVTGNHLFPGQTVIDVGININNEGKLCGDVNFAEAEHIVAAITPVNDGVGTVTTAVLLSHVTAAAGNVRRPTPER